MSLPIRLTLEDVELTLPYLAKKPTGATIKEIAGTVGDKLADSRRVSGLQLLGLIEDTDNGKYKLTDDGRQCSKSETDKGNVLRRVIRKIPAYMGIIERAFHRKEVELTATDVAAHWHDHYPDDTSNSEAYLKEQVTSFFQVAQGAGLGSVIVGRRGALTRFSFNNEALHLFITTSHDDIVTPNASEPFSSGPVISTPVGVNGAPIGMNALENQRKKAQGIFIAHGKNKKPLEQLKKILEQFRIPYSVATDEPNLGRPISKKVREIMESCNCAILIFTADEEFKTTEGHTIWRPSENVVHELGASGYLYDNRLVIMKEDKVTFPSNFHDIGYITFESDQLESKTMDILKELIGFGIVKLST